MPVLRRAGLARTKRGKRGHRTKDVSLLRQDRSYLPCNGNVESRGSRKGGDIMAYIVRSKVRAYLHENGRQVSPDGMYAIEVKFVEYLQRLCSAYNGRHKRVNADYINCFNGIK